jgi:alpha-N-arabinofuranosidase
MLPVEVNCSRYISGSESIDALNVSASIKDGVLSITICNLDPVNAQNINFDIQGLNCTRISGKVVTAEKINSYNDFGNKAGVSLADFNNAKINKGQIDAVIPSKSVVLIQLK